LVTLVIGGFGCFCYYTDSSLVRHNKCVRDPVKRDLTKHIGVDAYFVHTVVQDQVFTLQYVPSELQLADFFTKAPD
jgi:hypothetical protein